MRHRKGWVIGITAAVVAVGLAVAWSHFHVPSAPGAVAQSVASINYYPACGNEVLELDGTPWYPIARSDWETPSAEAAWPSGGHGIGVSVPMVAAPGPGDDVGTLTIYDNGIAYFVTDNGDIHTWLTTAPQTYNWVC